MVHLVRSSLLALALLAAASTTACGPPSAPDEVAAIARLRIASLNIWGLPLVTEDLRERLERLGPALRDLDADVICLQEVFVRRARDAALAALGDAWHATPGTAGGLVVLSRLPLGGSVFTPFPPFPDLSLAERIARKGLLETTVQTDAGPVRIVTTHLALAFGVGSPKARQLAYLLERLDRRTDLPTVLAGDFNISPRASRTRHAEYTSILSNGWEDADPPSQRPDGTWGAPSVTRVGWPRPAHGAGGWAPDRILTRGTPRRSLRHEHFAVRLATRATAVSDHNLILADLVLEPR